jgi:hypothetical protein
VLYTGIRTDSIAETILKKESFSTN